MSSNTATSVSKGCFAFKGSTKRAKEKDYLPTSKDKFVANRLKLYKEVWDELHLHIELLRSDLNSKIFDDLINFASGCHPHRNKNPTFAAIGEIPTAVLITGVNTPDHNVMFSNLDCMLKSRVTPLVARMLTHHCSRISTLIASLVSQLTCVAAAPEEEDGEETLAQLGNSMTGDGPVQLKVPVRKRKSVTMSTFVKWYTKEYPDCKENLSASPRKKLKIDQSPDESLDTESSVDTSSEKAKEKPLIIVMLEDAENINPSVLQDFISLCSSHLVSLPIVLVMGVATAVTAIHQLLPASISSLLCMQKYQAPPASRYLAQLLERIVMAPELPFKLGPKVFHFLLDIFLYHDFSILNFTMGFQHCMMEHYLNNPLSLLCCLKEEISKRMSHLTHAHLEDIRRQPAFMRYVEEHADTADQAKLLTDDSFTRVHLAGRLHSLHEYHNKMFAGLHFLHHLSLRLPQLPLGKQFRELYSVCLTSSHICDCDGYKEALALLRMMSLDYLCPLLEGALDVITKWKDSSKEIIQLVSDVNGFIHRLKNIEDEPDEQGDNDDGSRVLPQRAKLHELKEKLQSLSHRRYKSPYARLRDEIIDCLHGHFLILLGSPLQQPLHEILYFNELSAVKEQIKAAPRCSTQRALVQPGKYLNCACCQCDQASILPTMPDLCIVYKLHLECSTLVNLFDWLQAFVTIVTANDPTKENAKTKKKTKSSQKNPGVELRARFIRAVSELQFLGFIKPTRRKTDHVMRLTW
ncbi:origin recognition complex subunit 3-like [Elysia marginata]|uniref:Origin recognition complex subunit 3 n=1 Tax=Elysia marginata TaxID=1093978 RepID=A0AAV4G3S3_9GAST|nr:origin recognition complex subunit 3-like [Elysia marginata]